MIITCSLSHFLLVGVSLEIHPRVAHLEALVSEGTQPPSVPSASATRRPPFSNVPVVSLCITDDAVFPIGYKKKRWQGSNLKDIQWRMWYLFGSTTIACGVNDPLCFRYGTSGNRQVPCRLVKESACGAGYEGSSFIYGQYVEENSIEGKDFRTSRGVLSSRRVKGMTSGRPWVR